MSNQQLYPALAAPVLANALLIALLIAYINAGNTALRSEMRQGLDVISRRFDDMRAMWTARLHRVEEILDARLKHLEERRP